MHNSNWEAAAHSGRYKRNLMGSSRTIKIEIPRVLPDFICYQEVSGEGEPRAHVDRQPIILHQEYGDCMTTLVSGKRGEDDDPPPQIWGIL